jgi:hypothetical protein
MKPQPRNGAPPPAVPLVSGAAALDCGSLLPLSAGSPAAVKDGGCPGSPIHARGGGFRDACYPHLQLVLRIEAGISISLGLRGDGTSSHRHQYPEGISPQSPGLADAGGLPRETTASITYLAEVVAVGVPRVSESRTSVQESVQPGIGPRSPRQKRRADPLRGPPFKNGILQR